MTIARDALLVLGIVVTILLIPSTVGACPKCFGSTDSHVLHTYYLSALFLSAIPFGIIGSILAWLFLQHKQQINRSKETNTDRQVGNPKR